MTQILPKPTKSEFLRMGPSMNIFKALQMIVVCGHVCRTTPQRALGSYVSPWLLCGTGNGSTKSFPEFHYTYPVLSLESFLKQFVL